MDGMAGGGGEEEEEHAVSISFYFIEGKSLAVQIPPSGVGALSWAE